MGFIKTLETMPPGSPDGILCPDCGSSHHMVTDSRPTNGFIRRRHSCIRGHRFSSMQAVTTSTKEFIATMKIIDMFGTLKPDSLETIAKLVKKFQEIDNA